MNPMMLMQLLPLLTGLMNQNGGNAGTGMAGSYHPSLSFGNINNALGGSLGLGPLGLLFQGKDPFSISSYPSSPFNTETGPLNGNGILGGILQPNAPRATK